MNGLVITPQQAEVLASIFRPMIQEAVRASQKELESEKKVGRNREVIKTMRSSKYCTYPRLRRIYRSYEEIGNVINKGVAAVNSRMTGKIAFTVREKELLLRNKGIEPTAENKRKYFDIGKKEERR
ncbi:MAG: hypothetical protein K5643_05395 [Saccharofermentans sp.]|nr:hypothetical protein [Saccharofermentans sp.]